MRGACRHARACRKRGRLPAAGQLALEAGDIVLVQLDLLLVRLETVRARAGSCARCRAACESCSASSFRACSSSFCSLRQFLLQDLAAVGVALLLRIAVDLGKGAALSLALRPSRRARCWSGRRSATCSPSPRTLMLVKRLLPLPSTHSQMSACAVAAQARHQDAAANCQRVIESQASPPRKQRLAASAVDHARPRLQCVSLCHK